MGEKKSRTQFVNFGQYFTMNDADLSRECNFRIQLYSWVLHKANFFT